MNILRFVRKCVTDQVAARHSAKLVLRSLYGQAYWALRPTAPLRYRIASGGVLLLEAGHSFTHCFWPGVDLYEPDVCAALLHFLKPGGTFIDCGANIGYFSVLSGGLVGPQGCVVSVEANPLTYRLLQRNLALNGFGTAVHCALTNQPGEVELYVPREGGDVFSSIKKGGLVHGDDIESFRVPGRTLDEVVASQGIERIDVVKIDVEGAELDVLRSARRVLSEFRPVILCEYGTNTWPAFNVCSDDLLTLLAEHNYQAGIFAPAEKQVRAVDSRVWDSPYANLVLQPCGRAELPAY